MFAYKLQPKLAATYSKLLKEETMNEEKKTNITWQTTRPKLASTLMSYGYKPEIGPNPWDPNRTIWTFRITTGLAQVVTTFYEELGKPVPQKIAEYLEGVQ